MCTINKSAHTKKSGNLFNDPRIYKEIYLPIGIMVRVFPTCLGHRDSIPGRVIPKAQKWYLMAIYLIIIIIKCGSRVSGAVQEKE